MTDPGKTFVGGSFLYLDEGGGYQEKQEGENRPKMEKIVQDRGGIMEYQRQMKEKRLEAHTRKKDQNKLVEKPVLIPIRDTPVEPVPEPMLENQKCERATQEQFDFFQTYVSLKEKERQFEEEQERQINSFLEKQKKLKERELDNIPESGFSLVMEKEESKPAKTKKIIKIKIKKKEAAQEDVKKEE